METKEKVVEIYRNSIHSNQILFPFSLISSLPCKKISKTPLRRKRV